MKSINFLVEYRNNKFYLKGSNEPLQLVEGSEFKLQINSDSLDVEPLIEVEMFALSAGTKLFYKIPAVGHIVKFELIDPLIFLFQTGAETKVETDVRCNVYQVVDDNLFGSKIMFEPFIAESLHQVYDKISRLFKPNANSHHANLFNYFKVQSSGLLLDEYRKSKKLFIE